MSLQITHKNNDVDDNPGSGFKMNGECGSSCQRPDPTGASPSADEVGFR